MGLKVLLYWPNIIGYLRIGLVFGACSACGTPAAFLWLYSASAALDEPSLWMNRRLALKAGPFFPAGCVGAVTLRCALCARVDGWLARRLGQRSSFGAWLDVVVDNLSRGMLWSRLFKWGWLVSALEWCAFVCNHSSRGAPWKASFGSSPRLIRAIMANGFYTPLGMWVVSGLHLLPLWLYAYQEGLLSAWIDLPLWVQVGGAVFLAAGRLLALSAEMWCIWTHIEFLTRDEAEEKRT